MERRDLLRQLVAAGLASGILGARGDRTWANARSSPRDNQLFPGEVPPLKWAEFEAEGFSNPVCGVVYGRKHQPVQGMALGGIDTGYMSLETNSTMGYCTIFNSICPQRGPLGWPFLGMTAGKQTWLLSSPAGSFGEYMFNGVQTPTDIRYWGHYPVADLVYEMPGSPVTAGLRSWCCFLPGDSAASNSPGAVFEVHLHNRSNQSQEGRIAFTFPGPTQAEAQITTDSPRKEISKPWHGWVATAPGATAAVHQKVRGEFSGLVVTSEKVTEIGYAIGVAADTETQTGGALSGKDIPYSSGRAWAHIGTNLPDALAESFGGSVSVSYRLEAGEKKTVPFVLAWYAPMWIGEGPHTFMHMYATRFKSVLEVAHFLSRNHESLIRRILAWQEVIYSEKSLPTWLRESLINILYLFPVNSLWAAARPPIGPCCRPEDGLFGMIDGIVEDPAVEPMPDTFYANVPIVYFFPDLALSTMRGYKAYQFSNGAAPWIFGGVVGEAVGGYQNTAGPEMAIPTPGYQAATTGPCYVDMVDRYWQRTQEDSVLQEFYPSIKRNTIYTMQLRKGDDGAAIISVPTGDVDPYRPSSEPGYHLEWFEAVLWYGMTPHVGGIHLANLRMAERMAEKAGDKAFAEQCRQWFREGSHVMETQLWTGEYYLAYYEPSSGKKSDDVFGYQLDGNWMARFHGLQDVFQLSRSKTTLQTIKRTCVSLTPYGAVNLARANGTLAQGVGYGPNAFFVPELYMLAMTYMYDAGERDFGLELARRCVEALTIDNGSEWNQPNIVRGDNGAPLFGSHYDQNMMLWALPAAVAGQDIKNYCAPGGLVDRIIQAAKNG